MAYRKIIRATDDPATAAFTEAVREPLRRAGYEILSVMANGAKARVYRVRSLKDGAVRALRICKPPEEREDFHGGNPGPIAYRLLRWRLRGGHENVVALTDSGRIFAAMSGRRRSIVFSVMELVEGPRLRDLILNGEIRELGFSRAVQIMIGVARAVEFLGGRGVRHGDVWPQNVLIAAGPGGSVVPKLIDLVPRARRLIEFHRRLLSSEPRLNDHMKLHMTLAGVLLGEWDKRRRDVRRIDEAAVMRYWNLPARARRAVGDLCRLVERLGPSGDMFRRPTSEFRARLEEIAEDLARC